MIPTSSPFSTHTHTQSSMCTLRDRRCWTRKLNLKKQIQKHKKLDPNKKEEAPAQVCLHAQHGRLLEALLGLILSRWFWCCYLLGWTAGGAPSSSTIHPYRTKPSRVIFFITPIRTIRITKLRVCVCVCAPLPSLLSAQRILNDHHWHNVECNPVTASSLSRIKAIYPESRIHIQFTHLGLSGLLSGKYKEEKIVFLFLQEMGHNYNLTILNIF